MLNKFWTFSERIFSCTPSMEAIHLRQLFLCVAAPKLAHWTGTDPCRKQLQIIAELQSTFFHSKTVFPAQDCFWHLAMTRLARRFILVSNLTIGYIQNHHLCLCRRRVCSFELVIMVQAFTHTFAFGLTVHVIFTSMRTACLHTKDAPIFHKTNYTAWTDTSEERVCSPLALRALSIEGCVCEYMPALSGSAQFAFLHRCDTRLLQDFSQLRTLLNFQPIPIAGSSLPR